MRLLDARRLRGPSLGASGPGAIAEIALDPGDDARRCARAVVSECRGLATALNVRRAVRVRAFDGGFAVHVRAPIDALSPTVDLIEAAVALAVRPDARARRAAIASLRRGLADERSPRLRALERGAARAGLPLLAADDTVSVGSGARALAWPRDRLPRASEVPWRSLGAIPVALVTGTNGKTTTTRLVARIAKLAGLVPGNTSSDGVAIDEVIVEAGDNTGGESARRVLRDPRVEIAILETARGGLLRRGLAVTKVDAALITNVSADHLGEHGVLDLATLVQTKAVVGHAVKGDGKLVLGADDPELVRIAPTFAARRVWFAVDPIAARAAIARGETTFFVRRGAIVRVHRGRTTKLVRLDEVPIADRGRAPHNVKNALAAAALAWSLGLPDVATTKGMREFGAVPGDNPGRGNVVTSPNGVRVLLDFGHNPAAATDLYAWARALAGGEGRVHAVLTQPGDRDDAAIGAFARAVVGAGARSGFVWETESLLRGRPPGAIRRELARALRTAGLGARAVVAADDEASAIRAALAKARRGDVVVVSPSLDRVLPR